MIRFKHKFLLVLLIVTIIGLVESISVDAALEVEKSDIKNVGASSLALDVDWQSPSSITTTGSLAYKYTDNNRVGVYWNTTSISPGSTLSGTYTVTYENCGYDSAGYSIDLTITSSVTSYNANASYTVSWSRSECEFLVAKLYSTSFEMCSFRPEIRTT